MILAKKYLLKPVEIEAMQFTGDESINDMRAWSDGKISPKEWPLIIF